MSKVICNKCGKEIKAYETVSINHHLGYYSKFDMNRLEGNFCNECFDTMVEQLVDQCKINPMLTWTGNPNDPYGQGYKVKVMPIKQIRIPWLYKRAKPRDNKYSQHLEFYNKHHRFLKPIIINSKTLKLVDGYINYLIAIRKGIKEVECVMINV